MIVAKYKFDKSIYSNLIPIFNDGYNGYTVSDEVDSENSNHVIRTIECDTLPTLMRFGQVYIDGTTDANNANRCNSLLKILEMNTSVLTNMNNMFRLCNNVTSIECDWNTSNVTDIAAMFQHCRQLTTIDVSNWNTSNVTDMSNMFTDCNRLTSLDVSNWNTSNVIDMRNMFYGCTNLTSLDLSNFITSNVTNMRNMFNGCYNLTSLDVSNWDTSKVTIMVSMFNGCANLTSLDVSNWDTSNVTNMDSMFNNTYKLLDIGMLYCTPSTINKITSNLPTTHTQTVWVQDTKPSECTVVSGVEFKEYKENSYMINLNSPLLKGDRIEVVDGKLCHYHKMGSVVLDGSENWKENTREDRNTKHIAVVLSNQGGKSESGINIICDTLKPNYWANDTPNTICMSSTVAFQIGANMDNSYTVNTFKQWLSNNPTTVVYELLEPYYEDITPLQSNLTLETYLESNLDIYTDLPIKTNLTYLTNIVNTSSIEEEINVINEGTDLTNLLEDEINN